ncbi:MAG: shikimate kinase [Acidimicrobiales bacterium]
MSAARPHIAILGMMGVGKTTVGSALAAGLGRRHVDSDHDIGLLTGMSGRAFAAENGVDSLHELEAAVLLGALAAAEPAVISAAASTFEYRLVRQLLPGRAVVVRLTLGIDDTLKRQAEGGHRRPMDREELEALARRREPFFIELEDLRIAADRSPAELVDQIAAFVASDQ